MRARRWRDRRDPHVQARQVRLWPSATRALVASSPWKGGKEHDLVREVSDAAARHGWKFGVYHRPGDMTGRRPWLEARPTATISTSSSSCSPYGCLLCVVGRRVRRGPNGKVPRSDWPAHLRLTVRALAQAVISINAADVRWCSEAGSVRANKWSVPASLRGRTLQKSHRGADDGNSPDRWPRAWIWVARGLGGYSRSLAWYPQESQPPRPAHRLVPPRRRGFAGAQRR